MIAFRLDINLESNIITIYNDAGIEQLALIIGSNVSFIIRDTKDDGQTNLLKVNFMSKVNDQRWHRLALSVKVIQ